MTFEQLLYVEVLSQSKSLSQAATMLHISTPGLSLSISQLESEVGFKIFDRNYGGSKLTKEGNELLNSILQVLNAKNQLDQTINNIVRKKINNKISIQYVSTELTPIINDCISEYLKNNHNVYLDISLGHSDSIIKNVQTHRIDAGYLALNTAESKNLSSDLEFIPLCSSSMSIMVGPNNNLYPYKGRLSKSILKDQHYCIFNDPFNHDLFDKLQFICGPLDLALSSDDGSFLVKAITGTDLVGIGRDVTLKDKYWAGQRGIWCINLSEIVPSTFDFGLLVNRVVPLSSLTSTFVNQLNNKIKQETKK